MQLQDIFERAIQLKRGQAQEFVLNSALSLTDLPLLTIRLNQAKTDPDVVFCITTNDNRITVQCLSRKSLKANAESLASFR